MIAWLVSVRVGITLIVNYVKSNDFAVMIGFPKCYPIPFPIT